MFQFHVIVLKKSLIIIAKPMSFSNYDDRILPFLDLALKKANLHQTYANLTPHSYAVRMKHMNAT